MMLRTVFVVMAVAVLAPQPQPADAFLDFFNNDEESEGSFVDQAKEGFDGLAEWGKDKLSGLNGQDVFDAANNVVGKIVDGVVELKDASGISSQDIFDKAGDLIGKAAKKFGLSDIDGEDVFNAAGDVVGHVTNGVVYLSDATGISGQDIYDGAKNIVGTVTDSVKAGVDKTGTTKEDLFEVLKDGVQVAVASAKTSFALAQAATRGGSCVVVCGMAEKDAKDKVKEAGGDAGLLEPDENDMAACLKKCATTFGDTAGDIAGDALDGVSAMLKDNVCGSVDVVADVLGATITDLGAKGAEAAKGATKDDETGETVHKGISSLTQAGGNLFSGVLKGTCAVFECVGIAIPDLSNAAKNGIDAKLLLEDLDAALLEGDGKECVDEYGALASPIEAACKACGDGCAAAVATIKDAQIARINEACTKAASVLKKRSGEVTGCIADLTDLDEQAKELFGEEKLKLDEELSRDGDKLNVLAAKFAASCQLDSSASAGRTAPSAEVFQASVDKVREAIAACRADATTVGCDTTSLDRLASEERLAVETAAALGVEVSIDSASSVLESSFILGAVGFVALHFF